MFTLLKSVNISPAEGGRFNNYTL